MLAASEFLELACPEDMIRAGLWFACRQFNAAPLLAGSRPYRRLSRLAVRGLLSLTLRRWLVQHAREFQLASSDPFFHPEPCSLLLEGHSLHILPVCLPSGQPPRRGADLLEGLALAPGAWLHSPPGRPQDRLLFAGLLAGDRDSPSLTAQAGLPAHPDFFVLVPGRRWSQPDSWQSLRLRVHNLQTCPMSLSGGGWLAEHLPVHFSWRLASRQVLTFRQTLACLSYLQSNERPSGPLLLSLTGLSCRILPADWHNLWIRSQAVCFCGTLTRQEFIARSRPYPASRRGGFMAVPVSRLENMSILLHSGST